MDKELKVALRLAVAVMITVSTSGAVASWFYMGRTEAGIYTGASLLSSFMWIRLWIRLERMFREITTLQIQIEQVCLRIMDQLNPKE